MHNLPEKIDSKFRYVLLSAHRAEQLMRGSMPKDETDDGKSTIVAMGEVFRDEIGWTYGTLDVAPLETASGAGAAPQSKSSAAPSEGSETASGEG
jgi:DNA-directed RNA polymerase subunit K/omega